MLINHTVVFQSVQRCQIRVSDFLYVRLCMHTTHLCRLVLVLAKKFEIPAALKSFSLRHQRSSNGSPSNQDIYWTWRVIYYIDGETVNRVNLNFLQKLKYFMLLVQKFFLVLNFEDEKVYPCEVCSEELFLTDKILNLHTTWRSIKFKSKRLPFGHSPAIP